MHQTLATATVTREQIEARSEDSDETASVPLRPASPRTVTLMRRLYRVRRNISSSRMSASGAQLRIPGHGDTDEENDESNLCSGAAGMRSVVMKFGGACFGTPESTTQVAQKIVDRIAECGHAVVVVVSARCGATDALIEQMRPLGDARGLQARDMMLATGELQSAALLAAELLIAGHATEVIAPWTVFRTDKTHGDATISEVHAAPVLAAIGRNAIPIVPGFIGATDDGSITTLGRGGTDYSAVALGVALQADCVELYKAEVDGVYDVDPHTHPAARRFRTLNHVDALILSRNGARVLQTKAAHHALRGNMTIRVKHAFHDDPGTLIGALLIQEPLPCSTC
jgi:aspartate kinase